MQAGVGLPVVTTALVTGTLLGAVGAPPVRTLCGLALGIGLAGLYARRGRPAVLLAAAAIAASAVGAQRSRAVLYPTLSPDHVAHLELPVRAVLEGRVVAAPELRRRQTILVVEAERVGRPGALEVARGRVRLAVRRPGRHLRFGDRLRVETTLRLPRNFENPGRFDYVRHLARTGVHVTAFVWEPRTLRRLPSRRRDLRVRLERWRERVAMLMAKSVPGPSGALLRALVLGDQGGIPSELRDAFTRAGVVHVLSVSGLHVTLVAAGAFTIGRHLLARSERLLLAVPVERLAAAAALIPVALYAVLSGLGIPVLRATVMVLAATAGGLIGRRIDPLRSLTVAALVLVLVFPAAPLDVGFQLSFVSVAAIAWGVRRLRPEERSAPTWQDAALVSPCALLGTAPLTAFHFGQLSLAGLVANPVVVPIFGSAVVLLGLFGALAEPVAPAASAATFLVAGRLLDIGVVAVRVFAAIPGAAVDVPMPSPAGLTALYGLLLGLTLRGATQRVLLAGAFLALLVHGSLAVIAIRGPRPLRVTFLDVGQGDAAVVEFPDGHVVVVDAGGFPGSGFDTGEGIVVPFLRYRGIRHLDALAMTHAHPDHSAGLPSLLRRYRPREFWWTGVPGRGRSWRQLERALGDSRTRVRVLAAGTPTPGFAHRVAVAHPGPDATSLSLNDSSLTLRLDAGGLGILLTGDVEAAAEAQILARRTPLESAVLKVPHHGSRTSSTPGFVAAVRARVAVVSVGADNRYRLPAPEVEARYAASGACVLRTDRCGAVTVTVEGGATRVRTERPGCACP